MSKLLNEFSRDVELVGLVGEQENAQIILLAAVSAKLAHPLNVTVSGPSAAGKNHLLNCVGAFLPDEDKKPLTGMSPKTLMHAEPDEYKHKVIFIAEYEGVSSADYAIRTMQSERVIQWSFVESSKSGIRKRQNTVNGPASFIQATTRSVLHPENETRMLFIELDESPDQTHNINKRQAEDAAGMKNSTDAVDLAHWHQRMRAIPVEASVRIVFAPQLVQYFPSERIRSRRDFPKLLGMIEASALLHHAERPRDQNGSILALPEDYYAAKALFEHTYARGPERKLAQLLAVAESLSSPFTITDVMRQTGWGKTQAYTVNARALELGCIAESEERGRYILLRKQAEPPLALPDKVKLPAEFFRNSAQIAPLSEAA